MPSLSSRVCSHCQQEIPKKLKRNAIYCSQRCVRLAYKKKYGTQALGLSCNTMGALSELRVAADLLAKGYDVFRALSPSASCDLAILKNGKPVRVEVKTTYRSVAGEIKTPDLPHDKLKRFDLLALAHPDGTIYYRPTLEELGL